MNFDCWINKWDSILKSVEEFGGRINNLKISSKATEEDVIKVEREIGLRLPESFRKVVLEFAAGVNFSWSLPKGVYNHSYGTCDWNLYDISDLIKEYQDMRDNCFNNPDDPYDMVWQHKLPFMSVPNGDLIAFSTDGSVIYLSHDDGEGHGYVLGNNFIDFIDKWTSICCVGPEEWHLTQFIDSTKNGINPCCTEAENLRKKLTLEWNIET